MQVRRPPPIRDPILEPYWRGIRVLAHFRAEAPEGTELELLDEAGEEVSSIAPALADLVGRSIIAFDAVVDGILTDQATADPTGVGVVASVDIPRLTFVSPRAPELSHAPSPGDSRSGQIAFVAVDLLRVDGQELLDLPLLERKRLLESLFVESALVRVSPYTRPPLGPWLRSWKSAGFRGVLMKAANSRYRPGEHTAEWTLIERESQR